MTQSSNTPDLDAVRRNVLSLASGLPNLSAQLPQWTPERVQALPGLPADEMRDALRQLADDLDELIGDKAAEQ